MAPVVLAATPPTEHPPPHPVLPDAQERKQPATSASGRTFAIAWLAVRASVA
jgi:hypothetical protein